MANLAFRTLPTVSFASQSLTPEESHHGIHIACLQRRNRLDRERQEQCYTESIELTHQIQASGQYLGASPLQPVATATSVRVRKGKQLVTDGPFAETRKQLGGYFLIDAAALDEAIAIAGRIPTARKGTVEIRPILELSGLATEIDHKNPADLSIP